MSKKRSVDIDKLRLGMTNKGQVLVGIPDENGALKPEQSKDVTADFESIMNTQFALMMVNMQRELAAQEMLATLYWIQSGERDGGARARGFRKALFHPPAGRGCPCARPELGGGRRFSALPPLPSLGASLQPLTRALSLLLRCSQ